MFANKSRTWLRSVPFAAVAVAVLWPSTLSLASEVLARGVDWSKIPHSSDGPSEILKTWTHGQVFAPGPTIGGFIFGTIGSSDVRARLAEISDNVRYPVVVYLHDAAGISAKIYRLQKMLEVENIAMVLPNSFARTDRKADCQGKASRPVNCTMSPDIYRLRHAELIHAVDAARRFSWVDQGNVFLMGSGEGAGAVALWGGEVDVSGYIIIDWTCTAPADQPWFDGLKRRATARR